MIDSEIAKYNGFEFIDKSIKKVEIKDNVIRIKSCDIIIKNKLIVFIENSLMVLLFFSFIFALAYIKKMIFISSSVGIIDCGLILIFFSIFFNERKIRSFNRKHIYCSTVIDLESKKIYKEEYCFGTCKTYDVLDASNLSAVGAITVPYLKCPVRVSGKYYKNIHPGYWMLNGEKVNLKPSDETNLYHVYGFCFLDPKAGLKKYEIGLFKDAWQFSVSIANYIANEWNLELINYKKNVEISFVEKDKAIIKTKINPIPDEDAERLPVYQLEGVCRY